VQELVRAGSHADTRLFHKAMLEAKESGQPIVITQNGKATAVLIDVESYERQREALLLLRYLAVGEEEIGKGKGVAHEKALRHFERKLKELRGE